MSQLIFVDKLSIGLPLVDAQHKQLISLSNSLIQAMTNGMGEEVIEEVFMKLRAYVCYHFDDEEAYMKQIGFSELEDHKRLHRKLAEEVDKFRGRFKDREVVSPNEVLDFVIQWVVKHIEEEDMKIGQFARSK